MGSKTNANCREIKLYGTGLLKYLPLVVIYNLIITIHVYTVYLIRKNVDCKKWKTKILITVIVFNYDFAYIFVVVNL